MKLQVLMSNELYDASSDVDEITMLHVHGR